MDIRKIQTDDIPYIQKMFADLQNLHAENEPEIFVKDVVRPESYYYDTMSDPNKIIYVAVLENGERVGCIKGKIIDFKGKDILKARKYGYIDGIFVIPCCRGRLYEYKLQKELFKWFKNQGINHIEANVWEFNVIAKNYYEMFGYKYTKHGLSFDIEE